MVKLSLAAVRCAKHVLVCAATKHSEEPGMAGGQRNQRVHALPGQLHAVSEATPLPDLRRSRLWGLLVVSCAPPADVRRLRLEAPAGGQRIGFGFGGWADRI